MDLGQNTSDGGMVGASNPGFSGPIISQDGSGLNNSTQVNPQSYSQGGDIVLAPSKTNKKRHLMIIIGIAVVAVLIGIGFLIWFINNSAPSAGNLRIAFNRYANYLLYGEESTNDLEGEYERNRYYKLYEMLINEDEAYFAKLGNYLDKFEEMYDALEIEDEEVMRNNVGVRAAANMAIVYGKNGRLNSDELLELVVKNDDINNVYDYVENFYSVYNEKSSRFYDLIKEASYGEVKLLYKYKDAGCIVDGVVNKYGCSLQGDYTELETEYKRNNYYAMTYVNSSMDDIIRYTWSLNDSMREWAES